MAAAVPHGGSAEAAAAAAAPPSQTADGIDVAAVAAKHGWDLQQRNDYSNDRQVQWIPVAAIRRPLQGTRSNDPEKVAALMKSIEEIGLQEPIDVLEVDGKIYGFSGCHRFEAHQRLGRDQILCRVRKATPQVLKFHMM
ncbi:chloroplastic mitochondrial [Chlorella sorokiniana]|jgi:sulfiredoxin|uniref:sulfiredoxin n=1 Tax=Chlorella sorokiniana TaxID=3076 RepID=A0A2P6TYJ0_CHLSO|nr:chloroplastic mitochondrial [Chlorella sorokiniana]|eukprot:PRW59123.1 chloroplastic mitochondrial [Chlorella sorokiniana]